MAILLRTGTRDKDVVRLSRELLENYENSLYKLSKATLQDLLNFKGLGRVKAVTIFASLELAKRLVRETSLQDGDEPFNTPEKVFKYCIDMRDLKQEVVRVLFLDSKLKLIASKDISRGTLNVSIVHPRDVFREAVLRNSSAIVLVHNHPSGDATPSGEDVEITVRIKRAGETLGIPLLDHVIIGTSYYSFRRDSREVRWDNVGER